MPINFFVLGGGDSVFFWGEEEGGVPLLFVYGRKNFLS